MRSGSGFAPLPIPQSEGGEPRRTGVEVEFSGLDVPQTVEVVSAALGGEEHGCDPFVRHVRDTVVGDIKVELDTVAKEAADNDLVRHGLNAARSVVPLEIVTEPLDQRGLQRFSDFLASLRTAGAHGSRSGVLLGFGVHLNPAIVAPEQPHTIKTLQAYGLLDAYLRRVERIDLTRRALPFVAPWPDAFVTALVHESVASLDDVLDLAAKHLSSRNHGLDIFPLLKHAAPERFEAAFSDTLTSARPTFHFRLPDCRIDEPDWDLTQPWALWHVVETVAAQDALLSELASAWHTRSTGLFRHGAWADDVSAILETRNLGDAA